MRALTAVLVLAASGSLVACPRQVELAAPTPETSPAPAPATAPRSTPASRPDRDERYLGPVKIPAALRAISRFEPSGLVWVEAWQRYLVVSDDTGLDEADNTQRPWLFTMSSDGELDAAPRVVADVKKLSDLEAIAWLDPQTLLLLCSQSRSKKGRRPPKRACFVRVRVEGEQLRATGVVDLSAALLAAAAGAGGAAWLRELGLRVEGEAAPARDDFELNIEGLTVRDGAALLGLKQPIDLDGRALVWELRALDQLFATGRLERSSLRVTARLELQVKADGVKAPGGIADLLWLGDEGLLVCATYPGRPKTQDGSLWRWRGGSKAEWIMSFNGLKPEGIAPGTTPGSYVVVFDRWQETPYWTRVEVPSVTTDDGRRMTTGPRRSAAHGGEQHSGLPVAAQQRPDDG